MSVVAGRIYKNRIVVAADSQVTSSWHLKSRFSKILKVGDFIIGGAGYANELQFMAVFIKNHKPKSADESDIVEFFVEFYEFFRKKQGLLTHEPYNIWLIAFMGKLIKTSMPGFNISYAEYDSVGSGQEFARTALYFGRSPKEAVKVACDLTIYCGEPIEQYSISIKSKQEKKTHTKK